jgi:ribose/xylose/arabinose/galactoside ABC-type transport system permease subunit
MRFFLLFILFAILAFVASRIIPLIFNGKIFEDGAFKEAFREGGETLWLGMRLFVIIWICYLLLMWLVKHC